jgi:hypothetical protein
MNSNNLMKAIRWHPPAYDQRLEDIPIPTLQHPDDVIVKVKLAGLCGSTVGLSRSSVPAMIIIISLFFGCGLPPANIPVVSVPFSNTHETL